MDDLRAIFDNQNKPDKIYNYLIQLFSSGKLAEGQKLPPEEELAAMLNVSRISLREALQKLEYEGFIARKRGLGTFVISTNGYINAALKRFYSQSELIKSRGLTPGTKDVEIYSGTADEAIAAKLNLNVGDPVTRISRVRTANGKPFCYDVSTFSTKYLSPDTTAKDIGDSLIVFIQKSCSIKISHAIARLFPVICDEFLSQKVNLAVSTPLFLIRQVHYLTDNTPIWSSSVWYPEETITVSFLVSN
jgi:GntR family transcriptional regulator